MSKAKNYISGSAKEKVFSNGGSVINLSLSLSQLQKLPKKTASNGEEYISLVVGARQRVDKYGNTHSVYENTFVPNSDGPRTKVGDKPTKTSGSVADVDTDDLPF